MQYNTAQYKLEILTCVFHFIQSQGLTPSRITEDLGNFWLCSLSYLLYILFLTKIPSVTILLFYTPQISLAFIVSFDLPTSLDVLC